MLNFNILRLKLRPELGLHEADASKDQQASVGITTPEMERTDPGILSREPAPEAVGRRAEAQSEETQTPANRFVQPVESMDSRMVGVMRVILAFSGLLVVYIDPTEPQRLVALTYASLMFYCAYSVLLLYVETRYHDFAPTKITHWADVAFFIYLMSLTGGTSSIFFYFLLFAILVASFRWGFKEGLRVTVVSAVMFAAVGFLTISSADDPEWNRTLIRPIYLFVLGYMIAYWGGYEILLKRRLRLLKEIHEFLDPRSGVDQLIESNLRRLADFSSADSAILLLANPDAPECTMYRVGVGARHASALERISSGTAAPFLALQGSIGLAYNSHGGAWWTRRECIEYEVETRAARTERDRGQCRNLANLLDAKSFVTVPYRYEGKAAGRLYLSSSEQIFRQTDIEFLVQFMEDLSTLVQIIRLTNELVSNAAEQERSKISRDIHDTTIQSYIGLKLGLDALYRKVSSRDPLHRGIGDLVEMANWTLLDLRGYVAQLKEPSHPGRDFVTAVQEYVTRFKDFYNIDVQVIGDANHDLNGQLGAEAFQIVRESLSNIARHTKAKRAFVRFWRHGKQLRLEIGNETSAEKNGASFTPLSIVERCGALGGTVQVEEAIEGYTTVQVSIPIS